MLPCHIGCWLSELQIPRFARDDKERAIFPERAATEPKRFKNLIWTSLKFSRPCGTQVDFFRSLLVRHQVLYSSQPLRTKRETRCCCPAWSPDDRPSPAL